ncbi:MAG: hypothetical protein ACLRRT_05845 [Ruthenibacterium lactatiformans]
MLNDLFYAVLGMLPWTCALIAALLVLRHLRVPRCPHGSSGWPG